MVWCMCVMRIMVVFTCIDTNVVLSLCLIIACFRHICISCFHHYSMSFFSGHVFVTEYESWGLLYICIFGNPVMNLPMHACCIISVENLVHELGRSFWLCNLVMHVHENWYTIACKRGEYEPCCWQLVKGGQVCGYMMSTWSVLRQGCR